MIKSKILSIVQLFSIILLIASCTKDDLMEAPELVITGDKVIAAPASFHPFYKKYINASGIPIIGSENVDDEAFRRAGRTIVVMLAKRPDITAQMIWLRNRVIIMDEDENFSNLPDFPYASGSGGGRAQGSIPLFPVTVIGEENIMRADSLTDVYYGQDVLIHEFGHGIYEALTPGERERINIAYNNAVISGLWQKTYAITSVNEYFSDTTRAWFNGWKPRDGRIDTREKLISYDIEIYNILKEIYDETEWRPIPF